MAFIDEKVTDIQYAASSDDEVLDSQKEWTRVEERAAKWKSVVFLLPMNLSTY
jgi:hypothetical protein